MKITQDDDKSKIDQRLSDVLECLFSPDPNLRDRSLDLLIEIDGFSEIPWLGSILVSRILEPDLEIRYHIIQLLGSLMDYDQKEYQFSEQAMTYAQSSLDQSADDLIIKLLEVSDQYLASEKMVKVLLKMISYAGKGLSGIVNDRKQPVSLRQQAIFYCGEVGFLSTIPTLEILVQRIEKDRKRAGESTSRKKLRDEDHLYSYAITALERLTE